MTPRGKKIVATIEARMTSTRLPGKILKKALGRPMLELMIERLRRVPALDDIVVATTVNAADDVVADLTRRLGAGCYRGSEEDVLVRVLEAARANHADIIVETTGDCPLIDPALVQECIDIYLQSGVDYVSNRMPPRYPVGMDTQVFATEVLADVNRRTDDPDDHEHVSLFIYRNPQLYTLKGVAAPAHLQSPDVDLTLDTPEDLVLMRRIFEALYPANPAFSLADILALMGANHEMRNINRHVRRKSV